MTNQNKPITFTLNQTQRLAEAMVGADLAEGAKGAAFKLLTRKVPTVDDIPRAKEAFNDAAIVYAANKYIIEIGVFMHAIINGMDADKIKGVPVRTMRDLVRKTRGRWMKYYERFLNERVVDGRAAGATKKKRATKGAVLVGKAAKKPVDTVELKQAPDTTPVKRAIENVSSIPRMILDNTKATQLREGLRQEIEIAAYMLRDLLGEIES